MSLLDELFGRDVATLIYHKLHKIYIAELVVEYNRVCSLPNKFNVTCIYFEAVRLWKAYNWRGFSKHFKVYDKYGDIVANLPKWCQ